MVKRLEYDLSPVFFFFNDTATTEIYTLSLHDALPISDAGVPFSMRRAIFFATAAASATSSGCSANDGFGPGSRWPIKCSLLPATRPLAAAITWLASDTTCGVDR